MLYFAIINIKNTLLTVMRLYFENIGDLCVHQRLKGGIKESLSGIVELFP